MHVRLWLQVADGSSYARRAQLRRRGRIDLRLNVLFCALDFENATILEIGKVLSKQSAPETSRTFSTLGSSLWSEYIGILLL